MSGKVVYLGCEVEDPDVLSSVISTLQLHHNIRKDDELVLIGNASQHQEALSVAQYMIHLLRSCHLQDNDRQTILSGEDNLIMTQLCLAELSKQKTGDFDAAASEVLSVSRKLVDRKLCLDTDSSSYNAEFEEISSHHQGSLKANNVLDLMDVLAKIKIEADKNEELKARLDKVNLILLKGPKGKIEKEILKFIVGQKDQLVAKAEIPLSSSEGSCDSCDLKVEYESWQETTSLNDSFVAVHTPSTKRPSVTEAYVENVILSYLELLINSRNEIALSRVLNVPDRGLDHAAFTELKRSSKQRKMSMYQTAASQVMRIRLGGKSYAPDQNCPLNKHIKGLAEFVDVMQKMQTIVEEDQNTGNAIRRVLNVIRNLIGKHKDNVLRTQSLVSVVEKMQAQASILVEYVPKKVEESPKRSVGAGGSMWGRKTVKVIRQMLDSAAGLPSNSSHVDILDDIVSSQKTPLRFPSLLSKFRSPVEASPEDKIQQSLAERMIEKFPLRAKPQRIPRYQSSMDWAIPAHHIGFHNQQPIIMDCAPSKTIVQRAEGKKVLKRVTESLFDQENKEALGVVSSQESAQIARKANKGDEEKNTREKTNSVSQKRTLSQAFSQQPAKKARKSQPKVSKKKITTLAKGQKQLTSFFRM